jgi:hypothetical protein
MKQNNALVTYNDLSTMGLSIKGTPLSGSRMATKQYMLDNYYVNEAASPFVNYASNRLVPYQNIITSTSIPMAYQLTINTTYADSSSCYGQTDIVDHWTITLKNAAGNTINATSDITFYITYDTDYNYDYDSGSSTGNTGVFTLLAGHSSTGWIGDSYSPQRCIPSDICSGCYSRIYNTTITGNSAGLTQL